ncbi:hypothetical protein B0J13DRAFT_290112 [Dactylonectria estremocensis]|uniref:Uncharacterized protein n=1 Tax=Dactylonectria estremocensis TaxID=1079267 RepID=A0A9P9JAL6_9HYPO|nr:hypothetical protein B0J13DRAFT_290112 [Dactylonectria estremocensis]
MRMNREPLPEHLFLDLRLREVVDGTCPMNIVEPWATMYVDSVREKRYGDAIWARYHMGGDVRNGLKDGRLTVLEAIKEDAISYARYSPERYDEALAVYVNTSSADGHPEVMEIVFEAAKHKGDKPSSSEGSDTE